MPIRKGRSDSATSLDRDGAGHRIDHTGELDQKAVAHQLDQTAAMLGQQRLDQASAQRAEPGQRAGFVPLDERRVAGDVGREDRRHSALGARREHAAAPGRSKPHHDSMRPPDWGRLQPFGIAHHADQQLAREQAGRDPAQVVQGHRLDQALWRWR